MNELMLATHGLLVVMCGVVIYLLRNPKHGPHLNGAGELYKRIEAAEQRLTAKLDALKDSQPKGKR